MPSNLLDLKGPEFLTFYIITLIGLIVILAIARMVVSRLGGKEDIDPKSLSPHELAFLAAGSLKDSRRRRGLPLRHGCNAGRRRPYGHAPSCAVACRRRSAWT